MRYELEDALKALQECSSLHRAAEQVGISRTTITRIANDHNVSLDHMIRRRGRITIDPFVISDKPKHQTIRKFYSQQVKPKCSECGLKDTWQGKPIVIELDHINGNSCDNRLENLRWLCPNCHTQTPTNKGRNSKRVRKGV